MNMDTEKDKDKDKDMGMETNIMDATTTSIITIPIQAAVMATAIDTEVYTNHHHMKKRDWVPYNYVIQSIILL